MNVSSDIHNNKCGYSDCFTCPYPDCIESVSCEKHKLKSSEKARNSSKKWREEHPNYMKEYKRKWYQENRERELARVKERAQIDKEVCAQNGELNYRQKYYQTHKDAIKKKSKKYYQEHKEEIKQKNMEYYYKKRDEINPKYNDKKRRKRALSKLELIRKFKAKIEFEERWLMDCDAWNAKVSIAFDTLREYAEQLERGFE